MVHHQGQRRLGNGARNQPAEGAADTRADCPGTLGSSGGPGGPRAQVAGSWRPGGVADADRAEEEAPHRVRAQLAWSGACAGPLGGRRLGDGRNVMPPTGARRPCPPYIGDTITGDPAMFTTRKKLEMPTAADALPGRPDPIPTAK